MSAELAPERDPVPGRYDTAITNAERATRLIEAQVEIERLREALGEIEQFDPAEAIESWPREGWMLVPMIQKIARQALNPDDILACSECGGIRRRVSRPGGDCFICENCGEGEPDRTTEPID